MQSVFNRELQESKLKKDKHKVKESITEFFRTRKTTETSATQNSVNDKT